MQSGTGTLVKDEDNGFEAEFKPGSATGEYVVTAACGASQRMIRVKVVEPKIYSVTFDGTEKITITKDNGTVYSGEYWKDDDLDGTSDLTNANADATKPYQPVAYVSTDKMAATPVFKPNSLKSAPADNKDFVAAYDVEAAVKKARFAPPQTGTTYDWSDSVNFTLSGITLTAKNPFNTSAKVEYKNTYALTWSVGFGESGTADNSLVWYTSASEHELYLTYKAASGSVTPYETVLHIGCTNADGKTTENDIVDAIWAEFTDLEVKKKGATSTLKYYGAGYSTGNFFQTVHLLSSGDGRCGAWARFFCDLLQEQGISATIKEVYVSATGVDGFLVKNWTFVSPTTTPSPPNASFPYLVVSGSASSPPTSGTYQRDGISGQGPTTKPAAIFFNHAVLEVGTKTYDPSYGEEYNSSNFLSSFVTNALDGFFIKNNNESWATNVKLYNIATR